MNQRPTVSPQAAAAMRGAVDLGALAAAREAQQRAASAPPAPEGAIVDVTIELFEQIVQLSTRVPVIVDMWSPRSQGSQVLSPMLEMLAAEYAGRFVLAKVNADAQPEIAQAFQAQQIPTVMAILKGQPVPMFQGAPSEEQVRQIVAELLKVAAQEGVTGSVGRAPVDSYATTESAPAEEPIDPRFIEAFDAIEAGDWAAAEAAYQRVLANSPADTDAQAGVLLSQLMQRVENPAEATDDFTRALQSADDAAGAGDWHSAFELLISVVRATSGDERNAARQRLLDFFTLAGDDPAIPPARIALASALF